MHGHELRQQLWDDMYRSGELDDLKPVSFMADVVRAIRDIRSDWTDGPFEALYIGIGNGHNLPPLAGASLDRILGVDISQVALAQLTARTWPDELPRTEVMHGDIWDIPRAQTFAAVLGLNVFHFLDREHAHLEIQEALAHVHPGGIFALEVNAALKQVPEDAERHEDGSYSIHEEGVSSHWFSGQELATLFRGYEALHGPANYRGRTTLGLRTSIWDGIWRKPASAGFGVGAEARSREVGQ